MKKRIITDNLDWVGNCSFRKYKIIKKDGSRWIPDGENVSLSISDKCVKLHPDWFEDVEEEKYKVKNIKDPLLELDGCCSNKNFLELNKFIDKKQVKLIEDALNGELYTDKDLLDCVAYIINNIINVMSRYDRCMTPIQNYIDEWKKKK